MEGNPCERKVHTTERVRSPSPRQKASVHWVGLVGHRGSGRRRRRRLRERAVLGLGELVKDLDFAVVVPGDDDVSTLKIWHGLSHPYMSEIRKTQFSIFAFDWEK